jgi:hypothetical protein
MDKTKVISGDKDGVELRREEYGRYIRCDGSNDSDEINEALESPRRTRLAIPAEDWERIFGAADNRQSR